MSATRRDFDASYCRECGLYFDPDYPRDRADHRRRHDGRQHGPKVLTAAARCWPDDPVAIVDAWTSPTVLRRLAYDISVVVKDEMHWDFASFPHPYGTRPMKTPRSDLNAALAAPLRVGLDEYARAYLYRRDGRVVGYWVVWPRTSTRSYSLRTQSHTDVPETLTRSVGPIWTHRAHRRTGVASALYAAVLDDTASPIAQAPVSVDAPLSDAAIGFFSYLADNWLIS